MNTVGHGCARDVPGKGHVHSLRDVIKVDQDGWVLNDDGKKSPVVHQCAAPRIHRKSGGALGGIRRGSPPGFFFGTAELSLLAFSFASHSVGVAGGIAATIG